MKLKDALPCSNIIACVEHPRDVFLPNFFDSYLDAAHGWQGPLVILMRMCIFLAFPADALTSCACCTIQGWAAKFPWEALGPSFSYQFLGMVACCTRCGWKFFGHVVHWLACVTTLSISTTPALTFSNEIVRANRIMLEFYRRQDFAVNWWIGCILLAWLAMHPQSSSIRHGFQHLAIPLIDCYCDNFCCFWGPGIFCLLSNICHEMFSFGKGHDCLAFVSSDQYAMGLLLKLVLEYFYLSLPSSVANSLI